ncbi:MAG: hypothetical protein LQ351_007859 [Letrouitia transgressa]|nr:MAG: hypothetical protein LQ351_007859 [Letrouitia transgressa]
MKFHAAFILVSGFSLLTSLGSAIPHTQSAATENKICPFYVCSGPIFRPIPQNGACFCPLTPPENADTSHDATFEKTNKREKLPLVLPRQSPPQPPATLLPILNLATDLWAIQTVGTVTNPLQFTFLCSNFSLARLALQGYNTTSLSRTFCSAASSFGGSSTPTFPALDLINQLTIQYSTQIWITQAVGALSCNSDKKPATLCQKMKLATLCHLLDVTGANAVGLDGTAVKNQICAAAEGHPVNVLPVPVF